MKLFVFDLETIPDFSLDKDCIPVFDPASVKTGNLSKSKKEEKIAAKKKEFNNSVIKKMSCDPLLNKIICFCGISYNLDTETTENKFVYSNYPADDTSEIILEIVDLLLKQYNQKSLFVTFNGKHFDLPTIRTSAIRNDVAFAPHIYQHLTEKYSNAHIDLNEQIKNYNFIEMKQKGKGLDYCAKLLGLKGKTLSFAAKDVYPTWTQNDVSKIEKYCMADAELTLELFLTIHHWLNYKPEKDLKF